MGYKCNKNDMGKRAVRLAQISYSLILIKLFHDVDSTCDEYFDIRSCRQNNTGNIIQYHSIYIISIIQCRFNITRWVSAVLERFL